MDPNNNNKDKNSIKRLVYIAKVQQQQQHTKNSSPSLTQNPLGLTSLIRYTSKKRRVKTETSRIQQLYNVAGVFLFQLRLLPKSFSF